MKTTTRRFSIVRRAIFHACVLCSGAAAGGGFERDPHDLDLLFEKGRIAEIGARRLWVERRYRDVTPLPGHPEAARGPTASTMVRGSYSAPRAAVKLAIVPKAADCLLTLRRHYGASLDYGTEWIGRTDKVSFDIESESQAITCAVNLMPAGEIAGRQGQLRAVGGLIYEDLEVTQRAVRGALPADPTRPALSRLRVADSGLGWRAGLAWQVPDTPVAVSLVYASAVPHRYRGSIGVPERLTAQGVAPALRIPVAARADSPRSLQLDLRTVLRQEWLAKLKLRWVEWGSFGIIPVVASEAVGTIPAGQKVAALEAAFRNGLTIDAGLARRVPDRPVVVLGGLRWDRGTATGLNPYTNTWTASLGAIWQVSERVRLSVVGAYLRASAGRIEASQALRERHGDLAVNYTGDIDASGARLLQVMMRFDF